MDAVVGGWSETLPAGEDIQRICDEVKPQVEEKTGKKYETFRAVQYRSQVVAGTNYLLKVHTGGTNYIHLFVFQELRVQGEKVVLSKTLTTTSSEVMAAELKPGYGCPQPGTVAFTAKLNAGDSHPKQSGVLKFKTVLVNEGEGYSPGTGVFTCPADGFYYFIVHVSVHGCGQCAIFKNGEKIVKPKVEEKTGKTYGMFRAIEFRSQGVFRIVLGTNLLIKVKPKVEEKTNKKYGAFRAVKYKVLALCGGTHYLIKVKGQVEEKTGKTYGMFRAIEFRIQGVCRIEPGTNLLIKVVHVGRDDYLHLCIFHSFLHMGKPSVVRRVEEGHHKCDPIIIPKGI
ncbi:Leukocyte cysteine proteinase inhibitor 1 [Nibea albiflora]|nr:Leukocyte cysteine proteinase inhibitor 1 [Nibea albiflora]